MQKVQMLVALTLMVVIPVKVAFSEQTVAASRFGVQKTEHGYLRFDRKTGKVDFCNRKNLVWRCENINKHKTVDQDRTINHASVKRYITISSDVMSVMLRRFLSFVDRVNRRLPIH